ncbi:unnamed protein product [Ilex paraguariensis]|uniref:Uncharacterized protein n=1 Tax=Ilex paraguariensis TaxID=185542 RepID=A0ABC8QZY5_9AQUA
MDHSLIDLVAHLQKVSESESVQEVGGRGDEEFSPWPSSFPFAGVLTKQGSVVPCVKGMFGSSSHTLSSMSAMFRGSDEAKVNSSQKEVLVDLKGLSRGENSLAIFRSRTTPSRSLEMPPAMEATEEVKPEEVVPKKNRKIVKTKKRVISSGKAPSLFDAGPSNCNQDAQDSPATLIRNRVDES